LECVACPWASHCIVGAVYPECPTTKVAICQRCIAIGSNPAVDATHECPVCWLWLRTDHLVGGIGT